MFIGNRNAAMNGNIAMTNMQMASMNQMAVRGNVGMGMGMGLGMGLGFGNGVLNGTLILRGNCMTI
jgi:hypothetical protein